ncbi:transmembrane protein 41B [Pitangus sulphuratus]|nr:transmembrane protein 41B [Pitangus sulphuratus]
MAQRRAAERGPCQAAESARHQRQLLEGKALAEGGSARTSLLILVSIFLSAAFLMFLCSGLGASFCYMLSYLVGRPVVYRYLTEKAVKWSEQVERHREHLINYIIFLRITPFLPNWFINITSPVINVPLKVFFIGTFLGVAPPSFVAIKAGTTLYQLTTAGEAVSWNSVFVLMFLAILSILPALFQKKLKQKFE